MSYDYLIIGGGIVGLSTAWQLQQRQPKKKILLVEKEDCFAKHQTGHNSGVIHAGIYYTPDSLKARFCKEGVDATIKFCNENSIPFEQCGKLLVATNKVELERMQVLYQRGYENGLDVELINAEELVKLEPNIIGLGAILLKTTGIVDYREISIKMAERFRDLGGETRLNVEVLSLKESLEDVLLKTNIGDISSKFIITCTGLNADRTVKMLGIETNFKIIPFRGEYYQISSTKSNLVNHLIYPIPDPDMPFLGIHLTRMIDGSITVGPNANLGWKREGYGKINFSLRDVYELLLFPGFWKMMYANYKAGITELKNSYWKAAYLRQVQKYCPIVKIEDLEPYPAGIRAQAVLNDGTLVSDFLFAESPRSLHVCNAPSPAATSSIPIGNYICDKLSADI